MTKLLQVALLAMMGLAIFVSWTVFDTVQWAFATNSFQHGVLINDGAWDTPNLALRSVLLIAVGVFSAWASMALVRQISHQRTWLETPSAAACYVVFYWMLEPCIGYLVSGRYGSLDQWERSRVFAWIPTSLLVIGVAMFCRWAWSQRAGGESNADADPVSTPASGLFPKWTWLRKKDPVAPQELHTAS